MNLRRRRSGAVAEVHTSAMNDIMFFLLLFFLIASTVTNPNVRGSVLAVNQAYNFVVLNLGGRQGLEADTEMLVLRRGALIGKIRVSSVEPATAIGDIVTNSLARGVQVQPGDIVIYAGPTS